MIRAISTSVFMFSALLPFSGVAQAAEGLCTDFTGKTVSLLVPFRAGGGFDTYARTFAGVFEGVSGADVAVSNVTGAGGLVASQTVANADTDELMLAVFGTNSLLAQTAATELTDGGLDGMTLVGSMVEDRQGWIGRADYSLPTDPEQLVLFSVSTAEHAVTDVLFASAALGTNIDIVSGYDGTNGRFNAILAGEVDVSSQSVTSSLRAISTGDFVGLLVVSDAPEPSLPDVPYLAGPGGAVDLMTAGWDADKRAEAMANAQASADLSSTYRALVMPATATAENKACMVQLVEATLFSEELAQAAAAVNLPLEPVGAQDLVENVQRVLKAFVENKSTLDELIAAASQ